MNSSNTEQKALSKECIQTALLSIMETKLLRNISISEIAEKAGVSRNAFYRNFQSKEQVLENYVNDITEDFYKRIDSSNNVSRRNFLVNLFKHLYGQRNIIEIIRKNNISYMLEDVFNYYAKKVTYKLSDNKYTNYYIGGGLYALVMQWAKNSYTESPEEMSDILIQIQSNVNNIAYTSEQGNCLRKTD